MRRTPETIYDEWLVLRAQDEDAEALRILTLRWHGRLVRHAIHLTGNRDAASDVAQESWLAIVKGLRKLNDPARFPAWAFRIVSNKSADWVRTRVRDRPDQPPKPPEPSRDASSQSQLEHHEDIVQLRRALRELSAEHRAALSLHYLDGLSILEIAESLNIPPGTVKSRLHHARSRLRDTIERNTHEQV